MKKLFGSLFGGLVLGLPLAYWWIGYDSITYSQFNLAGVDEVIVREMDFDFVFYASLLVVAIAAALFIFWSWVEKKSEERFYRNDSGNSK